jgi:hypothetical protein
VGPALPGAAGLLAPRRPQLSIPAHATALGIEVKGVRVTAAGGFDTATWQSTGIDYAIEVSSDAPPDELAHLLEAVDDLAEIPRAIRAGARSGALPEACPRHHEVAAIAGTHRPSARSGMTGRSSRGRRCIDMQSADRALGP